MPLTSSEWVIWVLVMACMNMYNPEHQNSLMSPRISFSCDFITDSPGPSVKQEPDPSAPDFEFSPVDKRGPLLAADELFYKGKLLPLKEHCTQMQRMTLRDELQTVEEEEAGRYASQSRPLKAPIRWKGLLGRRRGNTVQKKQDKGEGESSGKSSLHPS